MKTRFALAAVVGTALTLAAAPAEARWRGHHHHHGWGWGAGAGFAAGALIASALTARPYYYYGGPTYYYDEPAYAYAPDDAEAYCEQRFRSYDPRSGTYLGYDGRRHPCP
jgi:hypothetical protein